MALRGSELLLVMMIICIETEFFMLLFFIKYYQTILWLIAFTTLAFFMYYLYTSVKNLRMISGHLCMSITLFYNQSAWDIDDVLIQSIKEYEVADNVIEEFESSDKFLQRFSENIIKAKINFPTNVSDIRSKFYYLELKKRLSVQDIEDLIKDIKQNDQNKLHLVMRDKLRELTKEVSKSPMIPPEVKEEIKQTILQSKSETQQMKQKIQVQTIQQPDDNTQTKIIRKPDQVAKEEQTIILDGNGKQVIQQQSSDSTQSSSQSQQQTNQQTQQQDQYDNQQTEIIKPELRSIKKHGFIALIGCAILLLVMGIVSKDVKYLPILVFITMIVIGVIIIIIIRLLYYSFNTQIEVSSSTGKDELTPEDINLTIKELFPLYPYCHFTHVKFVQKAFGFEECIMISQNSFFTSFRFARGMVRYNAYFYEANVSPCVMEWVGDIESRFPMIYSKFNVGLVEQDEQIGLTFNIIENAKLQTYYGLLCEIKADSFVKDNHINDLESRSSALQKYLARAKQVDDDFAGDLGEVKTKRKKVQNEVNDTSEEMLMIQQNEMKKYKLVTLISLIGFIVLVIILFAFTMK